MALITCKECSNQISSSAEVCPHCAYPIKKRQIEKNNLIKMFIILAFFIVFLLLYKFGAIDVLADRIFGNLFGK